MNQYMIETKEIERILASIQENYNRCKELQQQYVAYWETNHLESTETAMEVIEDLEVFAHTLAVLGKQWEEIQVLQETVGNHYLFETISELDGTQDVAGLGADIPMHEGVEGYDVGVALGMVQEEHHQEEKVVTLEKVEPTPPTESESSGWSLLKFFGFSSKSKIETATAEKPATPAASVEPVEPVELVATEMTVEPIVEECELEPIDLNREDKKRRCKHCTEDSPIPEEREKCCIVKQEKKKKKEKSKDKSKSKKKDTSIAKWAKKLSKWERYAEEHGDAWTEKVLEKVAKKAEKKAAKRDAKAIFKKHKLDRFAELSKEE